MTIDLITRDKLSMLLIMQGGGEQKHEFYIHTLNIRDK